MKVKVAALGILLICIILAAPAQATIQNPILSSGDTRAYINYLETFYRTVVQTSIGSSLWSGYYTFPIYDETGGDYFNYWIDDHGKILLAGNELGDQSLRNRASTFLMQGMYPQGFFPGRMVNSSLYRDVSTGSLINVDYFVTNRMIGLVNGSAVEGTKVFERAVTIGSIWDSKTATKVTPLDLKSPFVADIAPTELYIGNDTTHLRKVGLGGTQPSTQTLELIETIGSFPLAERSNLTVRRTINVVDPLAQITGVQLLVDTILTKWRPYAAVEIQVRNGWSSNVVFGNFTWAMASNDHYSSYIPYFFWLRKADGIMSGPTLLYRGVNATLWSSGSQPRSILFTGFQTPEFAVKGYKLQMGSGPDLTRIRYTWDFGHSVQFTVAGNLAVIAPDGYSTKKTFLVNPMEKTPWGEASAILALDDLTIPDGWTLSIPGSWGIVVLALAQYAKLTGNSEILARAKQLWNFYYADASQRLTPTWIPENPKHRPIIYYRSLYTHTLTGLLLDSSNSTYRTWAESVIQKAIIEEQDKNPGSANYGGLPFGLEEDGWAYALLLKMFQVTGNRNHQTIAHEILNAITANLGYTADTLGSWPPQPASCTAHLPSVITLNPDGSCSAVYSNHPQYIFRASEMLYGFILGSTFEGTDSPLLYDKPIMLATVTNLWKMSVDQGSGKMSVNTRYADDLTGQANSETQPLGMLALAIWKQQMWNRTIGVYAEKITGATVTSLVYETTGGNLTVSLKGPNSGSASAKFYYRDGAPSVEFTQGSGSGVYDSNTKMFTVSVTLNASGIAVFKIAHPTQPTGPDIAIIAVTVGAASAVVVGVIVVARKRVKG